MPCAMSLFWPPCDGVYPVKANAVATDARSETPICVGAKTTRASLVANLTLGSSGKKDWLGRQDSNLRMAAPKAAALPLGDAPSLRISAMKGAL